MDTRGGCQVKGNVGSCSFLNLFQEAHPDNRNSGLMHIKTSPKMTHLCHRKLVEGTYSCISHSISVCRAQKYGDGNRRQLQHHLESKATGRERYTFLQRLLLMSGDLSMHKSLAVQRIPLYIQIYTSKIADKSLVHSNFCILNHRFPSSYLKVSYIVISLSYLKVS